MARKQRQHSLRGFVILVAIVLISGVVLWSQGDLISPMESTNMLLNMSSGEPGFAMVGEPGSASERAASSDTANTDTTTSTESSAAAKTTTGTMTMEEFVAQLTAAGVDVEAVTATMSAGGRSLDNLLKVVNSGRVTVEDLATRLKGETASNTDSSAEGSAEGPARPDETSASLWDIHWDEFGSVAYDLWFILAVTIAVIVVGRPVGWFVRRIKHSKRSSIPNPILS